MPDNTYLTGRTSFFAHQGDTRFSYCLYVPRNIQHVLVYVHDTYRDAAHYRDALSGFGETNNTLIVAPLFPAGLIYPLDVDNYKFLHFHNIQFDRLLLAMLDEIGARYNTSVEKFMLGGFSGGAQFAHRFAYLHANRLRGVSIAAPGRVTLIDKALMWWAGTQDFATRFGRAVDVATLRQTRIQLIVGEDDLDDVTAQDDIPNASIAGSTRRERIQTLYHVYQQLHFPVQLDVVAGCAHEWRPLLPETITFFESVLED